jgi:pimeloyl-ACP methyl ester carboxylesterase
MSDTSQYFKSSYGDNLAYKISNLNSEITLFFFGGYASAMTGTKATSLNKWAQKQKVNLVRFDYSGHGESEGCFKDGTVTKWSNEAEEIFHKFKTKKNILVGSSMGGWVSLLVLRENLNDINGFIGIASAPDFTVNEWLKLSTDEQKEFIEKGSILFPDDDHGAYEVSYKFVNDGFNNLLLDQEINISCPIRLLHGRLDKVVPVSTSEKIIEKVLSIDKDLIIIEDGDHSLSREQDLNILFQQIEYFI